MANKKETLTMDVISQSNKTTYENVKEVEIKLNIDGEIKEFTIEMYKVFSPIGVKECLTEFIKNIDFAKNVNRDGFGGIQEPYFMYLLIKHFTTLGESMPNDFKEQLISMKHMINTTSLLQIMVHFDEDEIEKIKEELEIMLVTFEDNYKIVEEIKNKARNDIKNKDILE